MSVGDRPELDPIEETALMVAWWRACESRRPDALFQDPFALEMAESSLSPEKRRQYSRSPIFETTVDILAMRTVLIDERLSAWCAGAGTQVVNLGAGADSRPYRLPLPPAARVFQVDTETLTRWSESFFAPHSPSCEVVRVAADLHDPARCLARLKSRGFDAGRPVLWILEGLLEFLDRSLVGDLLAALTASSAPGSRLIAQVLDPEIIAFAHRQGDGGFPFKRLDPLPTVLSYLEGWRISVVSYQELNERFGRGMGNLFHIVEGERQSQRKPFQGPTVPARGKLASEMVIEDRR